MKKPDIQNHMTVTEDGFFAGPILRSWIKPIGLLPNGEMFRFSAAAAYFCKIAHQTLEEIPQQVTYEDQTDVTVSLRSQLDAIIKLYAIDDIEKLMRLMPICRQQAFKAGLKWSNRFQLWLDTGGHKQDIVTREESALSKTTDD